MKKATLLFVSIFFVYAVLKAQCVATANIGNNVYCFGACNGSASVSVSGGTGPFTYSWSTGTTGTNNINSLCALGTYSCSVSDAFGCSSVCTITVTQPPEMQVGIKTNPACMGKCNGAFNASVTGGTPPYSFSWAPPFGFTGFTITGLCTGAYTATVTDAKGCYVSTTAIINNIADSIQTTFALNSSSCSNICNGVAVANPTYGTAPYTFSWSTGATGITAAGLCPGNIGLKVIDANGCYTIDTVGNFPPRVNFSVLNEFCLSSPGSFTINAVGGKRPFNYSYWALPSGSPITILSDSSHFSLSNISAPASFRFNVTDSNGCVLTSMQDSLNVLYYSNLQLAIKITSDTCTGSGTAKVIPYGGGTPPYTYLWNTSPPQSSQTAVNLASSAFHGSPYTVKVTDALGCFGTISAIVGDSITLNSFQSTANEYDASCGNNNGSVSIMNSGGKLPYSYNWSNGATTNSINNLAAGIYNVTVTDAGGCYEIFVKHVDSYSGVYSNTSITNLSCSNSGGTITSTPHGGTAPYKYSWNNGDSARNISVPGNGIYLAVITDSKGCQGQAYADVGYSSGCIANISGRAINDMNGNCYLDPNESGLPQQLIKCSDGTYTYTDWNGFYNVSIVNPFGADTIWQKPKSQWTQLCPASPAFYVVSPVSGKNYGNLNFYDKPSPAINDLEVFLQTDSSNPGFSFYQDISVSNNGTTTLTGAVTLQIDSILNVVSSGTASSYNSSVHTFTFNFSNIAPMTYAWFYVELQVPATTPLHTPIQCIAIANPIAGDAYPRDNYDTLKYRVTGSYDPNLMSVTPLGSGLPGFITTDDSILTYSIHFQNTGTYHTSFVTVIDTIDPNLDIESLRVVSSSGADTILLPKMTLPANNVISFAFPKCFLQPATADLLNSSGYIVYQIKLKRGFPYGTKIINRASIYFDYNKAIITNTTLNTIEGPGPSSVNNLTIRENSMSVFPNPASYSFSILMSSAALYNFKLYDLLGNCVAINQFNQNKYLVDVSGYPKGIYIVEVGDLRTKALYRRKIVVE